jgi:hypothetical protein
MGNFKTINEKIHRVSELKKIILKIHKKYEQIESTILKLTKNENHRDNIDNIKKISCDQKKLNIDVYDYLDDESEYFFSQMGFTYKSVELILNLCAYCPDMRLSSQEIVDYIESYDYYLH